MDIKAMEAEIAKSKKYRDVAPALVRRLCEEESAKHKKRKDIVKAVKNRLHAVYGAYAQGGFFQTLPERLAEAAPETVIEVLKSQTSSRERLAFAKDIFAFIYGHLPLEISIMDIGCGLNPLFLSVVEHPAITRYWAYDIDAQMMAALNAYFAAAGILGEAALLDAIAETPPVQADAAFLLKVLPMLEAQASGRAGRLLAEIDARYLVVTFPTVSLTGRQKGMRDHYAALYEPILLENAHLLAKEEIGNELIYLLRKEE